MNTQPSAMPLVSVIMPAYNAEKWLRDAAGSVLAQSFVDLELIIINDGSTDATPRIARDIADPRVRVIDKPNGGVSVARNTGMEAAQGTFIAFMDADDIMWPQALEIKVALLQGTDVDWVFSDMQRCDGDMKPMGPPDRGSDLDLVSTILSGRGTGVPGFSSNVVMHRRCFDTGTRFDPALSNSADQDMALRLAHRFTYKHIPQVLFGYRILPGSMSKNIAVYERDLLYMFDKAERNGLFSNAAFRRSCFGNLYWSIGGAWWKNAKKPLKALPWFWKAVMLRPALLFRPLTRA